MNDILEDLDFLIKHEEKCNCECDPLVGMIPCMRCDYLDTLKNAKKEIESLRNDHKSVVELHHEYESFKRSEMSLKQWIETRYIWVEHYNDAVTEIHAEVERLKAWVDDLQSGMYINCVYCGHRYGPDTEVPSSMAAVLKEHVEQCPDHPMSKLRAENIELRKQLNEMRKKVIKI